MNVRFHKAVNRISRHGPQKQKGQRTAHLDLITPASTAGASQKPTLREPPVTYLGREGGGHSGCLEIG
jgi:hypothetical protein